jgi:hypothetical protein
MTLRRFSLHLSNSCPIVATRLASSSWEGICRLLTPSRSSLAEAFVSLLDAVSDTIVFMVSFHSLVGISTSSVVGSFDLLFV